MTEIDFYILESSELAERRLFACKLVRQVLKRGHKVHIHCDDKVEAEAIDALLWSFEPTSFLAHKMHGEAGAACNVEIGYSDISQQAHHADILLNLSCEVAPFFAQFSRLAEVVVKDPALVEASRKNYAYYKQRNYPIRNHHLR